MSHPSGRNLFHPFDADDTLKSPPIMSPGLKSPGLKSPGFKSPGLLKSPMQGLFLNKLGNGSSTSINEMPHTPNGIRAQLGHLLPKHAYFRARVVIHQISSVPYVSGEFGVRWKFKGVQMQHPGAKQGLLDRVKARADVKRTTSNDHQVKEDLMSPGAPGEDAQVNVVSPGGSRSDVSGSNNNGDSSSGPFIHPPTRANTFSSLSSSISSHASAATDSTHLSTEWGTLTSSGVTSNTSVSTTVPTPATKSNSGSTTPDAIPPSSTPGRGMTAFLPLKDHSVAWSQTLDTTLKFDIDRENSYILPNPLKLVVMQRVNPDDRHGNLQNPRLGAVYLNLAEYVGQGSVERRYLLKESKTNATLKLTIELEHISGETHYIAPPLAKGEILTGLAGFLEKDAVKKRPRALDLYGPYRNQEELETDILAGVKSPARAPRTARSERRVAESVEHSETETEDESHDHNHDTTSFEDGDTTSMGSGGDDPSKMGVAFDVQRLPVAYGTKTTEMLIEALFNPVKVSDKSEETPFTIYEPSSPRSHKSHSSASSAHLSAGITPRLPPGTGERPTGLGLTGISTNRGDMTATVGKRQNSTSTDISSSWTTATTSDSASDRSSGASTSKKNRPNAGRTAGSHSLGGGSVMVVARSTPEGRVVVDHHPRNASNASTVTVPQNPDDAGSNGGGVRGWWKRTINRPTTPGSTRTAARA